MTAFHRNKEEAPLCEIIVSNDSGETATVRRTLQQLNDDEDNKQAIFNYLLANFTFSKDIAKKWAKPTWAKLQLP